MGEKGKVSSFLNFFKLGDDDFDDFYDDPYESDVDDKELRKEEKRLKKEQRREEKRSFSRTPYDDYEDDYENDPEYSQKKNTSKGAAQSKVVPIRTSASDVEVCIFKPANFGESQEVCDILLGGQPVIVNLEGIDVEEAQRIMDFVSGCIFSIQGNMRQISKYIFIFSPKTIDISGDYIKNVAENNEGISIPTLSKEF